MATKKKSTRKKSSVAGVKKLSGVDYKLKSCSTTKAGAKKKALALRKTGVKARVVGKCVYTRGSAKKKAA